MQNLFEFLILRVFISVTLIASANGVAAATYFAFISAALAFPAPASSSFCVWCIASLSGQATQKQRPFFVLHV